jgi:hypothetical protein
MSRIFNAVVGSDGFDTFMLRLLRRRGRVHPKLLARIEETWADVASDNPLSLGDLEITQLRKLPSS